MNDSNLNAASSGGEYLSFTLGAEHYGVDILKVQEIRGYDSVTRVPDAPDYIKGVINLRGTIVPVIDLRLKLRLEKATLRRLHRHDRAQRRRPRGRHRRRQRLRRHPAQRRPDPAHPRVRRRRRYPLHLRHRHPGRSHADPAGYRNPARQRRHGPAQRTSKTPLPDRARSAIPAMDAG